MLAAPRKAASPVHRQSSTRHKRALQPSSSKARRAIPSMQATQQPSVHNSRRLLNLASMNKTLGARCNKDRKLKSRRALLAQVQHHVCTPGARPSKLAAHLAAGTSTKNASQPVPALNQSASPTSRVCENLLEGMLLVPDGNRPNDWIVPSLIH